MVTLEFVVEAYLYTELMVSRVNDTPFPYDAREYNQPTRGRGRGRGNSQRGAGKGGVPRGTFSATPKRAAQSLEASSMQKKAKPAEPVVNKHGDLMKQICDRSGLKPDELLDKFISNQPNLAPKSK